jgi:murein DD-endopeptidase MepM/ murein hydrolase activator NlpD
MLGGMRKWVENAQKASHRVPGKQPATDGGAMSAKKDDENPWLSLSSPNSNKITSFHSDEGSKSQSAPSRWLGEGTSFYSTESTRSAESSESVKKSMPGWPDSRQGIVDSEKFGLKQDMPLFARDSDYPPNQQLNHQSSLQSNQQSSGTKSVFIMQCILAGVLVFGGLYIHQTNQPFAKTVDAFANRMLKTDYSNQITPVVANAFDRFHISIPTFGVHAAVYLHVPLEGKIDADYSSSHPEIWISGKQNEPVLAAGSGIVAKVENNGSNSIVEIDHGVIGTSVYTGLGAVTVRVHEYVDSGQVIGRMPQGPKIEDLHFSLTKGGKFENPHDYIHFPAVDGQ